MDGGGGGGGVMKLDYEYKYVLINSLTNIKLKCVNLPECV